MKIGDVLQKNGGTCIFPVGDCKTLCGAITLLDSTGRHTPFCARHTKEVEDIFRFKQQKENKKKHSLGKMVYRAE